ncbi:aminoglycoside adenylyltransferase domain-containing protein [Brevibacillus borstelensis]|uniref:aminoglycoside adenylyltransferase domain-containing protein n=2 Tax=Brevibacillus borstelensis TaxID=45462 RepID=UPI000469472A|nr:aminoglycoside adenylyltransferase domain-containing protein [Brevibacillus borstelensis]
MQSVSVPDEVQLLMESYKEQAQSAFSDHLSGIYVYGSIALGAFASGKSDIDFLTVFQNEPTREDLTSIQNIHKRLQRTNPLAKRMDGMYLSAEHLGKTNQQIPSYIYVADGKVRQGYWDINAVTWWTVKHHGIPFYGPEPAELELSIGWDNVVDAMNINLNVYWNKRAEYAALYLVDELLADAVCTLSRILYTLECKEIGSKVQATQYALHTLPAHWHSILTDALQIRQGEKRKIGLVSRWRRAKETQAFIRFIIQHCNNRHMLTSIKA